VLAVARAVRQSRKTAAGTYVFPSYSDDNAFGSFPNYWEQIFKNSPLSDVTPHRRDDFNAIYGHVTTR
jgi:hypothetical protein